MPIYRKPSVDEILSKYGGKIESQIKTEGLDKVRESQSYLKFKEERARDLVSYERWCKTLGNIIKIKASKKDEEKLRKQIEISHLDIEPSQALTLSVMTFISVFFLGLITSVAIMLISKETEGSVFGSFPSLFFFLITILSFFLFYFVNSYPERLANKWRLKASSQMVPAILYVVVYMRHTSNLEKAIEFASEHLQYPLALDFKKIFYDVAIGKFPTIKESLDGYLERWKDYSIEFIESFHLIESSLFEPSKARRIASLEKSLQVILDGVYEKMLKFTHDVKSPLTNVYMLAIMLPILGIALIPLASAMLGGMIKWFHIFLLYDLVLPFAAFFMMDKILLMRPGGYGEISYLEKNPLYPQYKSKSPYLIAFLICLPLFIIGLLPLIFHFTGLPAALGLPSDPTFGQIGINIPGLESLSIQPIFDFVKTDNGFAGPFGPVALFLSLFFPLGIALFFSIGAKDRTVNLIEERNKTKQLESEFNNSLFQLGNRLGNNTPPELVFGKVAESSKGLASGDFFRRVNYNIQQMGMSIEKAIFDSRRGVLLYYPSDLISTSMRVLIESSKKGLKIAAVSLMSISEYVKNIEKITLRLKDMLAEVISEMKSNMTFLAPLLSGIVVSLALMITSILGYLEFAGAEGMNLNVGIDINTVTQMFDKVSMVPPYYLQIIIGIYLIEIIFILTSTLVTIDSGEDRLEKTSKIGQNLKKGIGFYFITALIASLALFVLTVVVLGQLGG